MAWLYTPVLVWLLIAVVVLLNVALPLWRLWVTRHRVTDYEEY